MSTANGAQTPNSASKPAVQRVKKDRRTADEKIQELAPVLDEKYKQLNSAWDAIEKKLRSMLPPREVWKAYRWYDDDPERPQGYINLCLGLIKYRGDWRICHGRYYEPHEFEPNAWKPITECSAEERVEAIGYVDVLRDAIIEKAEKTLPSIDEALAKAKEVLSSL